MHQPRQSVVLQWKLFWLRRSASTRLLSRKRRYSSGDTSCGEGQGQDAAHPGAAGTHPARTHRPDLPLLEVAAAGVGVVAERTGHLRLLAVVDHLAQALPAGTGRPVTVRGGDPGPATAMVGGSGTAGGSAGLYLQKLCRHSRSSTPSPGATCW